MKEEKKRAQEASKSFRDATLVLEIRFRNIPEDKDIDLTGLMEEVLADLLEMEKPQMSQEIKYIE